jgi:sugar lactone lactonase YvrE
VLAGDGIAGHVDGVTSKSRFHYPSGITMDETTGTLYISDTYNHSIRKIGAKGDVTTIAGTGNKGYNEGNEKYFFGVKIKEWETKRSFHLRLGLCFSRVIQGISEVLCKDTLYVADSGNHAIRKIVFPRERLTAQLVEDMTKLQGSHDYQQTSHFCRND